MLIVLAQAVHLVPTFARARAPAVRECQDGDIDGYSSFARVRRQRVHASQVDTEACEDRGGYKIQDEGDDAARNQ